jgi:hypothetical protein
MDRRHFLSTIPGIAWASSCGAALAWIDFLLHGSGPSLAAPKDVAFLEANGFKESKFFCCLSCLRYTPYWLVKKGVPSDEKRHARIEKMKEQTRTGIMWRDLGLGGWLFDLGRAEDHTRIFPAVLAPAKNPAAAREKAGVAHRFAQNFQRESMAAVKDSLPM